MRLALQAQVAILRAQVVLQEQAEIPRRIPVALLMRIEVLLAELVLATLAAQLAFDTSQTDWLLQEELSSAL
jgi:hypothetical protein